MMFSNFRSFLVLGGSVLGLLAHTGCSMEVPEEGASEEVRTIEAEFRQRDAIGWLWSTNLDGSSLSFAYSYNSVGAENQVEQIAQGTYRVNFVGLPAGGNLQVVAYGADDVRCNAGGEQVEDPSGFPSGSGGAIISEDPVEGEGAKYFVRCADSDGLPKDSLFVASYFRASTTSRVIGGYGEFASTNEGMTISNAWNRTGPVSATRNGVGSYSVRFAGAGIIGGNVQVTHLDAPRYPYTAAHCKVTGWGGETVRVWCLDSSGKLTDAPFSVRFTDNPTSPQNWGAYVWAQLPNATSYNPSSFWTFTSSSLIAGLTPSQVAPTIERLGVGNYRVLYPYMPASHSTTALVTAYGKDSNYCKIQGWSNIEGFKGAAVNVRCFNSSGRAADTRFSQSYLYDSAVGN